MRNLVGAVLTEFPVVVYGIREGHSVDLGAAVHNDVDGFGQMKIAQEWCR